MVPAKELFLFQEQTALGYDYTTAGQDAASLAGTDLIEPISGSSVEFDTDMDEQNLVAAGLDQDAAVPGAVRATAKISLPMTPGLPTGTVVGTTAPYWMKVAPVAGFSMGSTTTAGASRFSISPINTPTSAGQIWKYSGDLAASSALLDKTYNMLADWKITIDGAKVPVMEYNFKGAYYGVPTDATQPTVTKARVSAIGFKGATLSFLGSSAYKISRLEINGNSEISHFDDLSQAGGIGNGEISNRKIKGTARVLAVKAATADPQTALAGSTQAATQIAWGSTTLKIQIDMTYMQITKCKLVEVGGLQGWDIEFQANRNDFKATVYPS